MRRTVGYLLGQGVDVGIRIELVGEKPIHRPAEVTTLANGEKLQPRLHIHDS